MVDDVGVHHPGGFGDIGQLDGLRALLDQQNLGGGQDVLARGLRRSAHARFRSRRIY